ncbi:MAG: YlmH/Sll1252 family protein [Lachnospiraceae bacterium]|nr:YlmH/Sll1252 family protein [Lachnospiraceae bacterium]
MDELLLKKRISELRKRAEFSYRTEFTDFLTLSEIETAKTVLTGTNYMFYGGLHDTERRMLCIAPPDVTILPEIFPICGIRIVPKNIKFSDDFSHRDVLGSVLGLGLERDVIGDIFIKEKEAYLLCAERIASFLIQNMTQVRHTNVICNVAQADEGEFEREYQTIVRTVSAIRIDSVAAAAFGVSRSSAANAVSGGKVFINGRETTSPSVAVKEQDVISFRGLGKARLKEIGSLTKKGRIAVTLERY